MTQTIKNLPAMQETRVWEGPLEKEMATHSSLLAWRIPWTEEPGRLHFIGHKESDMTSDPHTSLRKRNFYLSQCKDYNLGNRLS